MTIITKIVKYVTLIRWLYVIIILLVKILQYKNVMFLILYKNTRKFIYVKIEFQLTFR